MRSPDHSPHHCPWNRRIATLVHQNQFRKLADLQEITHAWLSELQIDRAVHLMNRGLHPETARNLWLLDSLEKRDPNKLLEDAYPGEMLAQLKELIYGIQAWTLQSLIARTPADGRAVLTSVLEQSSWKTGRTFAEKILDGRNLNRSEMLLRFAAAPIFPSIGVDNFLVRRSTEVSVEIELLSCPHRILYSELRNVEDLMCRLHFHWARGFFYVLNPKLTPIHRRSNQRCHVQW